MGWRERMSLAGIPVSDSQGQSTAQIDDIQRIAALDAERNEADRQAGRGYDYDETAPSHPEYVARQDAEYETARAIATECETAGEDLARRLEQRGFRLISDLEEE